MEIFSDIKKSEAPSLKPPLVLVHGSWGASWMWDMYIPYLTKHGFDVYTLDLRGHGKSEGSVVGVTMNDYVADVKSIVEKHNLKKPVLIGHSMGGLVVLMYAKENKTKAVVAIDPSQSKEVQGEGEVKTYPEEYTPMDAGMPSDPMEIMKSLPDISQEMLMNIKNMLGVESGVARGERKLGVSVPKDALSVQILFVGGELGESVPFGIGIEKTRKMAKYYGKDIIEIKGATHPGILLGEHSGEAVKEIENWLSNNIH